ncbi:malate dehydrogenase (quinone) [Flavobacterium sp.]|uniref:malate dehydrogenase (quinone) n=1 Tax=Flavobacterium sp. TaxID=239 RepID=UPI0035AEE13E
MDIGKETDVVLIGAGIMSATLGVLLKQLNPSLSITIFERLDKPALESSDAWNNAGTGHSAFCELNYTPEKENGVDVSKAIKICEQFEISKQFWSYLVKNNILTSPREFINKVPHLSFVWGKENVEFLKKRYEALVKNPLFDNMKFNQNPEVLEQWMPLVMQNRFSNEVASTYVENGTDINFGSLTRKLFTHLETLDGVTIHYNHQVEKLKQKKNKLWKIKVKNRTSEETTKCKTKFVFIGAGGYSLLLLERANVKEAEGYGGFPVGGQWLKCNNQEVINQHFAKVYGKATVGAPPMSVPHLDTRFIEGKRELLFGPFAGFSTKFLKNGSYLDLINSIEFDNIKPMLYAGWNNIPLTKYLIEQVLQSEEKKIEALKEYFPNAKHEDWELLDAGQRVQVIKKDEEEGGILEFGTEIISTEDNTLAALLGASPGASTSVSIMIEVLKQCFEEEMKSTEWKSKLTEMIPSFGKSLNENPQLCEEIRNKTSQILKIN